LNKIGTLESQKQPGSAIGREIATNDTIQFKHLAPEISNEEKLVPSSKQVRPEGVNNELLCTFSSLKE